MTMTAPVPAAPAAAPSAWDGFTGLLWQKQIDVLTQIAAVTKALQAVSIGLVEDHLSHCVVDAARQSPEDGAAKDKEAADAIARLVRS